MRIGTITDFYVRKYGDAEGIRKLAEAGFDCMDYGFFHYPIRGELFTGPDEKFEDYFTHLGNVVEESGIGVEQVHSPMPSYVGKPEEDEYLFYIQDKSIKAASYMKSKYIVIHPCIPGDYKYTHYRQETKELNMKFYRKLLPTLDKYNVKLAIENMFNYDPVRKCICPTVVSTAEEILDYIYTLNDEHFVACLDVGHANLTGETPEHMARLLSDKLEVLHVHDNHGLDDEHDMPYMGTIDWAKFNKALVDINYKGAFSFEVGKHFARYGNIMPLESARFLYELGKAITNT